MNLERVGLVLAGPLVEISNLWQSSFSRQLCSVWGDTQCIGDLTAATRL